MDILDTRFRLIPFLLLLGLLVAPAVVESQCAVIDRTTYFDPNPTSPTFIRITKTLDVTVPCAATSMYNAYGCGEFPSAAGANQLIASALTATVNPFCNWVCNCGASPYSAVTISTNATDDGLPVELMDFAIEEPESGDAGAESDAAADGPGEAPPAAP